MDEKPVVEFVEELLAFDENELPTWLHYYKENLTVAIIKYIKDKYANTSFIRI